MRVAALERENNMQVGVAANVTAMVESAARKAIVAATEAAIAAAAVVIAASVNAL